jgi:hypothetical protein
LIEVKSFELIKGKRGEMIEIEKPDGGKKTVIRFMVDETAFSFGPKAESAAPAKATAKAPVKKEGSIASLIPGATDNRSVSLTRAEALDLLHVARNLADLLADKLIQETLAG